MFGTWYQNTRHRCVVEAQHLKYYSCLFGTHCLAITNNFKLKDRAKFINQMQIALFWGFAHVSTPHVYCHSHTKTDIRGELHRRY